MKIIRIATDYTDTPVGRFLEDGPFSGQRFREDYLNPALSTESRVKVDIDGVEGYGSSFLEEAFGGLVRRGYYTAEQLKQKLEICFRDPGSKMHHDLIWKHINDAKPESKG